MRKFSLFAIAAAVALAFAAPAGATVINLSGVNNASTDGSNAQSLSLDAGTYNVTFTQGQYTAFNRWSSSSGCDTNGENCRQGWEDSARIGIGSTTSPTFYFGDGNASGDYGPKPHGAYYETASDAFTHAAMYSLNFTLSAPTDVYFWIYDNNVGDNQGGVSLQVVRVPEPAGWPFLMAGFVLLGLVLRRRRVVSAHEVVKRRPRRSSRR